MKKIILYSMFCLSGLFIFNSAKADDWDIVIEIDFCDNKEDGLYGNSSDCRWYYQCFNNQTTAKQCGPGLVFDWDLKTCDYPWVAYNEAENCPSF